MRGDHGQQIIIRWGVPELHGDFDGLIHVRYFDPHDNKRFGGQLS
jgi:hypothetical protein